MYLGTGLLVPFSTWRKHVTDRDHPVRPRAHAAGRRVRALIALAARVDAGPVPPQVAHWYNPPEPGNLLAQAEPTSVPAPPAAGPTPAQADERRMRTPEERWAEQRASDALYRQFRRHEL